MKFILFLVFVVGIGSSAHDFSNYPFKSTLNADPLYELYWNFDNDAETISFAVRVETTGWVGLGLSPNGQMPNSDVVIGWVTDDGQTMFHDRFAAGRAPPTIDEQQDWTLISGDEEGGFTILEFSRKYITCDDNDLPITTETARVIWSLGDNDPSSEVLTFSDVHSEKGSRSLNLLAGLPNAAPDPADLKPYDVTVDNITIPDDDTTYWCAAFKLPDEIINQKQYITKFSPVVTVGNEAHVHHLLIYICDGLNDAHVGNGGDCEEGVANEVAECRSGALIGSWAVGGEMFVYPDNVAFPFGGDRFEYLVMEIHYDNPDLKQGTLDSSGLRFWYSSTPREHDAGVLMVGHFVNTFQIIPPNSSNFSTSGIMTDRCTQQLFPEDGIRVFANGLHTHVAGRGLTVQHIRYNSECDVYEELQPIDQNLKYDFDFQQITHLKKEISIKRGDIVKLNCYYNTTGVNDITFGGLSTRDEMCLTFLFYYPKIEGLSVSLSQISEAEYNKYLNILPTGGLNAIEWTEDKRDQLQQVINESPQFSYCGDYETRSVVDVNTFPTIGCSYIAPNQCAESKPASCCAATEDGEMMKSSVSVLMLMALLTTLIG